MREVHGCPCSQGINPGAPASLSRCSLPLCLFSEKHVVACFFLFLVEGPADLDKQSKKVDAALQIPSMPNRHGGGYKSNSASKSSTTAKLMQVHPTPLHLQKGCALPMPCKSATNGSRCLQSGRTTCQYGPGQALCSRLPCRVQCRSGPSCYHYMIHTHTHTHTHTRINTQVYVYIHTHAHNIM